MRIIHALVIIFIVLLGVSFACFNAEPVVIHYYIGNSKLPLSLLLAISLVVGVVLGFLVTILPYLRVRAENYRLQRRISTLQKQEQQ